MNAVDKKWRKQFWVPVLAVGGSILVVWGTLLTGLAQYGMRVYGSDFSSGWQILLALGTVGVASTAGYLLTPPGRSWLSLTLTVTGFITLVLAALTVAELQHVIGSDFFDFDSEAATLSIGVYLALIGGVLELGSGIVLFLRRREFV